MNDDLTHTTETGEVEMVDIGNKPDSVRHAVAQGRIRLHPETVDAIRNDQLEKGNVLATARIGTIQAVKRTWDVIPLCHQIPVTNIDVDHTLYDDNVLLTVRVVTTGKTGCEMEAVHGVLTGLTVIWDMVKSMEKSPEGAYPATRITDVEVLEKHKHPTRED